MSKSWLTIEATKQHQKDLETYIQPKISIVKVLNEDSA